MGLHGQTIGDGAEGVDVHLRRRRPRSHMDPSDRSFIQDTQTTATNPHETLRGLAKQLVADGIFDEDFVTQHSKEISAIWRDWRQRSAPSPPDSNIGARQDDTDASSLTGKLSLYGPVDNQVSITTHRARHLALSLGANLSQVKDNPISLFRPLRGNFCFASSRLSEGAVSFIQEKTIKNNNLEPEDDGTIIIQWKYSGRVPDGFEDRDDQSARHTLCVVLSANEVKEVEMIVDVVFGISCAADLDQQRSHIPPPPCPTPPCASSSDVDQMDGPARSSFGDSEGAVQQMVPISYPGNYQLTRPSQAEPTPFVNHANQVFIFNKFSDPAALIQQISGSLGNREVAPGARMAASSMTDAQAAGSTGKRKADGDSQGFGRPKRFHG